MNVPKFHFRPPNIHWHLYFTRKVLMLGCLVAITYVVEYYTHIALINKAHELALGTLFEHLFFGIPFTDEVA
jgi:hypothetical protein